MKRRQFIAGLGSVAAWPFAAHAQQSAIPVIAYLSTRSADSDRSMLAAFRRGLYQLGFEQGRNLTIEYRFADGQYDRVPALVTELVRSRVRVIVLVGVGATLPPEPSWQELRASQIPIVFNGGDPISTGLVSSYNRPGGNMTGIVPLGSALTGKDMSLLHELVPNAKTIALLSNYVNVEVEAREAAVTLGLQLLVLTAGTEGGIDAAFAALNQQQVDADQHRT